MKILKITVFSLFVVTSLCLTGTIDAATPTPTNIIPTLYCLGTTCPVVSPIKHPTKAVSTSINGTNPNASAATAPSKNPSSTTNEPCVTETATATSEHKKKQTKKQTKYNGGSFFQKLFEIILKLLELFSEKMGILPPAKETHIQQPCLKPTEIPAVTTKAPNNLSNPTQPPSKITGRQAQVEITFYGAYDNDPKGSRAISNPVIHKEAGGTGTYKDPLTFASPEGEGEYKVGQIIYVPLVQKYFIREDICALSWTAPTGCGPVSHVDLYMGNPSEKESVIACEEALTPSGKATIIIDPADNLSVDPTPLWNQATGTCMKPH